MSRTATALIVLLLATAIGLGVYDFYRTHEYKDVTTHTGFRGEARYNAYYALRLFLKRMGIPTETRNSIQGMGGLPDTDTLLFITTSRSTLSAKRTDELINWVKAGGHLITRATSDWTYRGAEDEKNSNDEGASKDPLQRFMGVKTGSRNRIEDYIDAINGKDNEEDSVLGDIVGTTVKRAYTGTITFDNGKHYELESRHFRSILVDEAHQKNTEQIPLHDANFIVRQKVGKGLITLISKLDFLVNKTIEENDHADLVWALVHGQQLPINQPANIWLIHRDEMPSLWSLLWKNAWAFLVSLLLLFIAWLMMSSRRFGPMIPKAEENRRSLMEHITSSGNFYWKHHRKDLLLDSARKALIQRLNALYPAWHQYSKEEQIKKLAAQVSISEERLHALLYSSPIEQSEQFTQMIQQLEQIQQKLIKSGGGVK